MLITNEKDEMCVFLTPPEPYISEPDSPEVVYDGGEHALLYRNPKDTVILDYIAEGTRGKLAAKSEVLIIEYDPVQLFITREYMAPISMVGKLPNVSGRMLTREELRKKLEEELETEEKK
jgi:hypothetical protein